MKVYISGMMSGMPEEEYKPLFAEAERKLKELGHEVVNPSAEWYQKKYDIQSMQYKDILALDIHVMSQCDAVCALRNWMQSNGAKTEIQYAIACGMPFVELKS